MASLASTHSCDNQKCLHSLPTVPGVGEEGNNAPIKSEAQGDPTGVSRAGAVSEKNEQHEQTHKKMSHSSCSAQNPFR